MKVKEILELTSEELERIMTEEEYNKMKELDIEYVWQLLDMLQDSARQSGQDEDEEYVSISDYLDYMENMRDC